MHKTNAKGQFGEETHELFYVPVDEFEATDKSRKALVRMHCQVLIDANLLWSLRFLIVC